MRRSNYDTMKLQMRGEFLKYDQDAMIGRFGLRATAEHIFIPFLGREYSVDRRTGDVASDAGEAGYNEAMTIYDVLCYSRPGCGAAGACVNMASLSSIQGSSPRQEGEGLFGAFAKAFDGRDAALAAACERLGGAPGGKGDVGYRIPMFDFLPVMLQFWDSDDEFPASLQLFVDANMLDFMHYETVWFAFSHLLERLREEMDRG